MIIFDENKARSFVSMIYVKRDSFLSIIHFHLLHIHCMITRIRANTSIGFKKVNIQMTFSESLGIKPANDCVCVNVRTLCEKCDPLQR